MNGGYLVARCLFVNFIHFNVYSFLAKNLSFLQMLYLLLFSLIIHNFNIFSFSRYYNFFEYYCIFYFTIRENSSLASFTWKEK